MRKTLAQRLVAALDERIAQLTAQRAHEARTPASLLEEQRSERL